MRRGFVYPVAVYAAFFVVFTWPWTAHFSSHLWSAGGDAHQNVWNLWWFDYAITELQQSPWHTEAVHFPYGTSLIAQTLSPLNGVFALGLLRVLSPVETYNLLVGLSFVVAGLTAFHLCWAVTSRYLPSLVGGFVFSFSTFHFAHAYGHLNLVSIQFIPLFLLAWRALLRKPSYRMALAASGALLLVGLCDLNLLLYSVVAGAVMLAFPQVRVSLRELRNSLAVFVAATLVTSGPLPLMLLRETRGLDGAHNPADYSADAFLVVLGGGLSRFDLLTGWAWRHLSGLGHPERADLGLVVCGLLAAAVWKRRYRTPETWVWITMTGVFFVLALGPRLVLASRRLPRLPLPYSAFSAIPGVSLSGVPIRMIVVASLAAGVVAATVLSRVADRRVVLLVGAALAVLAWPVALPESSAEPERYVRALQATPDRDPVLDLVAGDVLQLFNQTFDEHPRAFGYLTRTFPEVARRERELRRDIAANRFDRVCREWGIRYVSVRPGEQDVPSAPTLYEVPGVAVYDLSEPYGPCASRRG